MHRRPWIPLALALALPITLLRALEAAPMPHDQERAAAQKRFTEGNFKDAYEGFRKLALDATDEATEVGNDLKMARRFRLFLYPHSRTSRARGARRGGEVSVTNRAPS